MAKPNIVGLGLEALETRCLLNAALHNVIPLNPALMSGMNPDAEVHIGNDGRLAPVESFIAPHAGISPGLEPTLPLHDGFRGPPHSPLIGTRGDNSTGPSAFVNEYLSYVTYVFAPPPVGLIGFADMKPAIRFDAFSRVDQTEVVAHVSLPRKTTSAAEQGAPAEIPIYPSAKRAPAAGSDADLANSKTSVPAITQPMAGKSDTAGIGLVRDASGLIVQKGVPSLQPIPKDDRLTAVPSDNVHEAAAERTQANPPTSVGQNQRNAAPLANVRVSAPERAEFAPTVDLLASLAGADHEAVLPSPLVTSVLPFDIASLESSIKDFFDQVNQAGFKLSAGHVNLLFSSTVVALAATLAVEVSRRKTSQPAQAPALELASTIPYSDYL